MPAASLSAAIDVDRLPTLPAIAMEAIRLMEGEESSFASIAELLTTDQVLASRILHYANSAAVGGRPVTTIAQAISRLGFNAVRSIVLSATIFESFAQRLPEEREKGVNFWMHSIGVATVAAALAEKLGFPDPDEAYLAGLLHDIGKLVFLLQYPEEFAAFHDELASQGHYSLHGTLPIELEKGYFGMSHMEAGKQVAAHWRFPDHLAAAIWMHHQPVMDTIPPEPANLGQLLRFADVICVTHNIGSSYFLAGPAPCHDHYHFALENLLRNHALAIRDIDELVAGAHTRLRELGQILGFWDDATYLRLVEAANLQLGGIGLSLDQENRQLQATNRMLEAASRLAKALHAGIDPAAATRIINEEAQKAFASKSSVCLLRHPRSGEFVGSLLHAGVVRECAVAEQLPEPDGPTSAIEREALDRLRQTMVDLSSGTQLGNGMVKLLGGCRFLATCFLAHPRSRWNQAPVLGELVVEIDPDTSADMAALQQRFGAFALTTAGLVERLLLEHHMERQADQLAAAARQIEEKQRQLFHSHRLATVGQLAAGAAHEINNPLTIISLNIQFLRTMLQREGINGESLERLDIVEGQVKRISKIIQDLLGFARPAEPKFTVCTMGEIIDRVLKVIGDRVSLKNITIETDMDDDLPRIKVDPLQIEQVLMNLLVNACHAMPDGGTITIACHQKGAVLETSVTDTGVGIDPKHLSRIFDPFFTTKKQGEGTGLGLAICNSIAEHNGGTLRVRSKLNEGSTFTLTLPVDRGERLRSLKESVKERQTEMAAPATRKKRRILIIDDEQLLNDMLRESLVANGYEADGALDGEEGISLLGEKTYDCVLLDIRMPRRDGLEVLQYMQEHFPTVKVIIITGLATKKEIADTVKMGAFACLKKPFQIEKILETIERALRSARGKQG